MSGALATEVLGVFARAGVREFCVCAGARNVSLVVALERSTGCRVWHFFDERSAAFFALGRMMGNDGQPVAVVTTSGTAVAELLSAAVEAHYQSLPLILLTADRPVRFRGSGAPQAIEQVGIFSGYAKCLDVVDEAPELEFFLLGGITSGVPRHVNICFEEPDAASLACARGVEFGTSEALQILDRAAGIAKVQEFVRDTGGLVILLGNLRADERVGLGDFLRRLGVPVLAEAGSGLREMNLSGAENAAPLPADIRKVLRIGGVPSARLWRDLESQPDVQVLSVSRGRFAGLARASEVVAAVEWAAVRVQPAAPIICSDESEPPTGEKAWFRFLSEKIPERARVFLGNSLPIREWNSAATFDDRLLECFSCRGANGIDGALSVFFGLSVDAPESWAIVGDLTALYDLSAPWILRELGSGQRRIVVINNGGGRIFSKLPALADLAEGERRAIENDHGIRLDHWAAMWGMSYARVTETREFVVEGDAAVIEIIISP